MGRNVSRVKLNICHIMHPWLGVRHDMASRLDNHLEEVLAARREGKSFATIAVELRERHGVGIGKRGVSAWYRRRQRRMRERLGELEDFGVDQPVVTSGAEIAGFPVQSEPVRAAVGLEDDDWMVPVGPRRIELQVVRSSQEL